MNYYSIQMFSYINYTIKLKRMHWLEDSYFNFEYSRVAIGKSIEQIEYLISDYNLYPQIGKYKC